MTLRTTKGSALTFAEMDENFAGTSRIATVTANTTLTSAHYTVLVDATGGNRTITLPAAAGATGRVYNVKKIDVSVNTVTLDGNGAEPIDADPTLVLTVQWQSVTIQSNGTGWSLL